MALIWPSNPSIWETYNHLRRQPLSQLRNDYRSSKRRRCSANLLFALGPPWQPKAQLRSLHRPCCLQPCAWRHLTWAQGPGKYVNEIKIRPIGVLSYCWCNGKSRKCLLDLIGMVCLKRVCVFCSFRILCYFDSVIDSDTSHGSVT